MIKLNTKSLIGLVTGLVIAISLVSVAPALALTAADIDLLVAMGIVSADKAAAAKAALVTTQYATLTVGSKGAEVTSLQQMLVAGGFLKMPAGVAYGYYGNLTATAYAAYKAAQVTTTTTTTTTSSSLEGGAGDLSLTDTTTGVKNSLKEGEENVKVLGITAEADGSDINVTSIKVTLKNAGTATSEKLSNYLDSVSIYMGSKEVGSADVSDFSKTSATPDTFSKTISLKDAIVKDGDDVKFYVAVSAVSDIDTEDITAHLKLDVNSVRFTDATGAILTASGVVAQQDFSFDSVSADTSFNMKSSSANPDADTVTVEDNEDSITDDVLALVFKLDVADDSEDIMITSIPVVLTVATTTATSTATIEDIIDSVTVTLDGQTFEADLSTSTVANNAGTATYIVDIDAGDVTLSGGDVKDVKVYLAFKGIEDGSYAEDTTVKATVALDSIDAETEDDELDDDQKGGSAQAGEKITLSTSAIILSNMSWTVATGGTFVDFKFTVKADTDDFTVLASSISSSTAGTATTSAGVLSRVNGDTVTGAVEGVSYPVAEGDTVNFRVRYTVGGTTPVNGTYREYTMTNVVGKVVPDDKQLSPTATINL